MALLDMQRATKEIGRIRIGDSVPEISRRTGKEFRRPRKLTTFKFTTRSRSIAEAVANVFGGSIEHDPRLGFGVVTEASEIGVTVPPGDAIVNQAWELWDGGACVRRCDGATCLTWRDSGRVEVPCLCPPEGEQRVEAAKEGNACKPTTRLNVIVPDLPDVGVWRLESHGYYAAGEIGDTARILMAAREKEIYLPARLWLDRRESKTPGGPTREWYVPMLTLDVSLRQLAAGSSAFAGALPAAPPDRRAITAGPAPAGPPDITEPIDADIVDEHDGGASAAQEIADRAADSNSKAMLTALYNRAKALGVLEESVTVNGATGSLGGYFAMRENA